MFSFFSCSSDDAPDYSQMEASGEIYVDGEIMYFNERSTYADNVGLTGDDQVMVLKIDPQSGGAQIRNFTLNFKNISGGGNITQNFYHAGITFFSSSGANLESGTIYAEKYVPNEYIKVKFTDVVFVDTKDANKKLSLKGGITFPIR